MLNRRKILIGASALGASAGLPVWAQNSDRPNPMPAELRKALERSPNAPVLGNPDGDITLTEFFDYNCPFCKKMVPLVQKRISADPGLRVVYREWPVFGEDSEFATRASLATLDQGKYWQFHVAMMQSRGRAGEATVMRVVRELGLDEAKLRRDMDSLHVSEHIDLSYELAEHMGLMGTPTFIAGDEGVFGEMTEQELEDLIERARKTLG